MLKKHFTYLMAKFSSRFAMNKLRNTETSTLEECTFGSLRQLYKEKRPLEYAVPNTFHTANSLIGKSMYEIMDHLGKPLHVKKRVKAGVVHNRLVFQVSRETFNARIKVEMINRQLATVTYSYFKQSPEEMDAWKAAIAEIHEFSTEHLNNFEFCYRDKSGNRVICRQHPEMQITYIHMDRAIEQSINAAVFFETFTNMKTGMERQVQLSA